MTASVATDMGFVALSDVKCGVIISVNQFPTNDPKDVRAVVEVALQRQILGECRHAAGDRMHMTVGVRMGIPEGAHMPPMPINTNDINETTVSCFVPCDVLVWDVGPGDVIDGTVHSIDEEVGMMVSCVGGIMCLCVHDLAKDTPFQLHRWGERRGREVVEGWCFAGDQQRHIRERQTRVTVRIISVDMTQQRFAHQCTPILYGCVDAVLEEAGKK